MQLPLSLQEAIDSFNNSHDLQQLTQAREELTQRYRQSKLHRQFMHTDAQRNAYLIYRLPATYASLQEVFQAVQKRAKLPIKSLLDLGAGPGTGMWAACANFPNINKITLIEKDPSLIAMGKQLSQSSEHFAIQHAEWLNLDVEKSTDLPHHDLILFSYSLGELDPQKIPLLLELCWKSTRQLLIVVEPGTVAGFERIRSVRQNLIEGNAHLIAPCPHHLACPMKNGDWCHFSARVERSSLHRRLKGGTLSHEDEKFSYVAFTKVPLDSFSLPPSRVLSQPLHRSGHVRLKLCTKEGIKEPIISKKMGALYKDARKLKWGDECEIS